jgi:hypothetical protein
VLSRFQFTIGQLVQVIMLSGFVFWMMRWTGVTAVLYLFPWIDFVVRARITPALSIGRRTLYRSLVLIAFGSAYCSYLYFVDAQVALRVMGFTFGIYFLFIIAPLLSRLWRVVINQGYQMPPTDDKCGPIALRGFGDRAEPAAAVSQRAVEMRSGASGSSS